MRRKAGAAARDHDRIVTGSRTLQAWKLCLTRRRKDAKVSAPGGCQFLLLSVYSEYSVVHSISPPQLYS